MKNMGIQMKDQDKSREQIIDEINQLRQKVFKSELQQLNQGAFNEKEISKKIQLVKDVLELESRNQEIEKNQIREELRESQGILESERARNVIEKGQLKSKLQRVKDILKTEHEISVAEREKTELIREKIYEENYDRNRFFSIISHDLRSPISSIVSFLDLILEKFEDMDKQQIHEILLALDHEAKNLLMLANSLLYWAKLQIGNFQIKWGNYELEQVIDENIQLFSEIAKSKAIRLYSNLEKDVMVYGDYDMINAVIRNLFSNALKFTDQDGEVKISIEKSEKNIVVSVSDSGVGMNEKTLNNIFKPSKTHTSPGTKGEEGTGFGLLLCKELIKKNRGDIWVESKEGLGTTVFFTLLGHAPMDENSPSEN